MKTNKKQNRTKMTEMNIQTNDPHFRRSQSSMFFLLSIGWEEPREAEASG